MAKLNQLRNWVFHLNDGTLKIWYVDILWAPIFFGILRTRPDQKDAGWRYCESFGSAITATLKVTSAAEPRDVGAEFVGAFFMWLLQLLGKWKRPTSLVVLLRQCFFYWKLISFLCHWNLEISLFFSLHLFNCMFYCLTCKVCVSLIGIFFSPFFWLFYYLACQGSAPSARVLLSVSWSSSCSRISGFCWEILHINKV